VTPGPADRECLVCRTVAPPRETATVRCNVRRYRDQRFGVWRCPHCQSLHTEKFVDLSAYYEGYPIRRQGLDYLLRVFFRGLAKRLAHAGFTRGERLLDYGCNTGLFVDYLRGRGFNAAVGYDPYVDAFKRPELLKEKYDVVFSSDVLEHDDDPRGHFARLVGLLSPGGLLAVQTPNAEGIDLSRPEEHLHQIHVPYHRHILSLNSLVALGGDHGLYPIRVYNRWYMDSFWPGCSRRFLESWLKTQGNLIDAAYEPPRYGLFFKHPVLLWLFFFGGFPSSPKTDHVMVLFRKNPGTAIPN